MRKGCGREKVRKKGRRETVRECEKGGKREKGEERREARRGRGRERVGRKGRREKVTAKILNQS